MLVNRHYPTERELIMDLADIFNAELRAVAAAGCRVIQVEEPRHHISGADGTASDADLQFFTDAINREIKGVETEVWLHTCWGNPNQQPLHWIRPSYERALPYLLQTNADVITLECASTAGRDLPLLGKYRTDKKIAIGVVSHTTAAVEPPVVADLSAARSVGAAGAAHPLHRLRLRPRGWRAASPSTSAWPSTGRQHRPRELKRPRCRSAPIRADVAG
jgi:methionine synthase II (cobalamin-independent)